jgi:hypothetical protein
MFHSVLARAEMADKSWNGLSLLVVICVFPALALITITLRVYTRLFLRKSFGLEDYMIIIGMIFSLGQAALMGWDLNHGLGRHFYTLTLDDVEIIFKTTFALNLILVAGFTSIKVSILLLYKRTIQSDILSKRICQVLLIVVPVHAVAAAITFTCLCSPIQYYWLKFKIPGKCLDLATNYLIQSCIFLVSDVILVFLPLIMLRHLMVPRRQKISLYLLLSMGGLAPICRILTIQGIIKLQHTPDQVWEGAVAVMWSVIEMNIAIICASASTLRPLAAKFFHLSDLQSGVQLNQISNAPLNMVEDGYRPGSSGSNTHTSQTLVHHSLSFTSKNSL